MRKIIKEEDYAFSTIYKQLEKIDFNNFEISPLINGGCGLGKTTALTSQPMFELFQRKLKKEFPKILVIESRSATRDQLRENVFNPHYHFLQFDAASRADLDSYDIIIVDEAHSLFNDSEFAPRATAPLADWLRKSLCFQIYITASDIEFIGFANSYFEKDKVFSLTFPDLSEAHVRYTAKEMYLSLSTKKVPTIIENKAYHFFQKGKRGLFFFIAAKDAVEAFQKCSELGYKAMFFISQGNETQIVKKEEVDAEENNDDLFEYGSRTLTIDVLDYYKMLEEQRVSRGYEPIREALLRGHIPEDIDFLFMTAVGQEGLSLYDEHLDFIFIEDFYPLTINQKLFRYRDNVDEVYVHLPQRRIEKVLQNTLKKIIALRNSSQEYLKGYYEGAGGASRKGLARAVWFDERENKYKVAENYISYLIFKSQELKTIRDSKNDFKKLKEIYGQYADNVSVLSSSEEEKKDILINFFSNKNGILLTERIKEEWTEELKEKGLTDSSQKKDFTFEFVKKFAREKSICDFVKVSANKKDAAANPEIEYRKKYLRVNFLMMRPDE